MHIFICTFKIKIEKDVVSPTNSLKVNDRDREDSSFLSHLLRQSTVTLAPFIGTTRILNSAHNINCI